MFSKSAALALALVGGVARAQDVHLPEPKVLGPGVISTPAEEFKATVSPDNLTLLYVLTDHQFRHMTIVESHRASPNAEWGTPDVASFSGIWRDGDPAFTPDGKRVLFISGRPPGHVFQIWSVPRNANGTWGEPTLLVKSDSAYLFAPSLTTSGVLYYSKGDSIYRVATTGAKPETLPFPGGDPAISADERYIVFDNNGDLFVACRSGTGWGSPRKFAEPVDSPDDEGDPWVSADGRTMYFYSKRAKPAPDRGARATRPTYADVLREVTSDIFNGTRNLYSVDMSSFTCSP
jgi:WD40-like Beta Propeller Repeat